MIYKDCGQFVHHNIANLSNPYFMRIPLLPHACF